ncbi:ankyrin repeat-containing protein BDA1-like [Phaseolus vulgaris]
MDKELVRAKMRGGLTLLHLASQSGDINLLSMFLKACPDSVKDLTARNETALHLYERFEVLEFLLRWLKTNIVELQTVLKQEDVEDNTILHIAATKNDTKAMKLLIREMMTNLDAANLLGQRAFDIIENQEIKKYLAEAEVRVRRGRKVSSLIRSIHEWIIQWIIRYTGMKEKMSNETRNAYMIAATLVATATYQTILSPPGGLHQIDAANTNNTIIPDSQVSIVYEGTSVLSPSDFMFFSTVNTCAFLTSTIAITYMMPKHVGGFLLYGSIHLLTMSYFLSLMIISPKPGNFSNLVFLVFIPIQTLASILF